MSNLRHAKGPVKVPRLRMKDDLLKVAPELAKLLGEEIEDPDKDYNVNRLDTPRGHEEEITEAEELAMDLYAVKRDRADLLNNLTHIKVDLVGSGGGEAQVAQIAQLERELEVKKLTLNELRTEGQRLDTAIGGLKTQIRDAKCLTPGGYEVEIATIKQLLADMKRLEDDLIEAEAKNRLYQLLGDRTRKDHMEMERKVRVAREMRNDALEDLATLTQHMHDMRAAKEEADRQLLRQRKLVEDAKKDWHKKMKDRKKEVQELEKRQEREKLREARRKERADEEARREKERLRKIELEREAHEMQIQELAPKIEAMEASWNRLRTITGADEPEEVSAYWEGLKSKEENMRQLVAASETNEETVKKKIEDLLKRRNEMLEADQNGQNAGMENSKEAEACIGDAHRKMDITRKKFEKLRTVCISAEQGLKNILDRIRVSMQEIEPSELVPVSNIPMGTPPARKRFDRRESRKATGSRESRRSVTPSQMGSVPEGDVLRDDGGAQVLTLASAQNTIDDDTFFEHLPELLGDLSERLSELLRIEQEAVAALRSMEAMDPVPEQPQEEEEEEDAEAEEEEGPAEADVAAPGEQPPGDEGEGVKEPDAGLNADADADAEAAGAATEDAEAAEGEAAAADAAEGDGDAAALEDAEPDRGAEEPATESHALADIAEDGEGDAEDAAGTPDAQDGDSAEEAAAQEGGDAPGDAPAAEAVPAPADAPPATVEAPAHVEKTAVEPSVAPSVPPAAPQMTLLDELLSDNEVLSPEELQRRMTMLNKGMHRTDWSGAPLFDAVNTDLKDTMPDLSLITRKTKGRRKPDGKKVMLTRIMGYTEDAAAEEEEEDEAEAEDDEEEDEKDGVLERDFIKRMAAKMEARAAKARAEAEQ